MKTIQHKVHPRVTTEALATVLLAACLWLAGPLKAQESKIHAAELPRSSVQGVVSAIDPQGQSTPLEGIPLKLDGESLGERSLSTVTNAEGHYEFTGLDAGTYSLEITIEGFQPFAKTVVLKQNEGRVENVALELTTVQRYPGGGNKRHEHIQPLMLGRSRKMASKLQDKRISGQRRPAEGAYDESPVEQTGEKR
jgi:Carboxypeptidase regulatory-like domain